MLPIHCALPKGQNDLNEITADRINKLKEEVNTDFSKKLDDMNEKNLKIVNMLKSDFDERLDERARANRPTSLSRTVVRLIVSILLPHLRRKA